MSTIVPTQLSSPQRPCSRRTQWESIETQPLQFPLTFDLQSLPATYEPERDHGQTQYPSSSSLALPPPPEDEDEGDATLLVPSSSPLPVPPPRSSPPPMSSLGTGKLQSGNEQSSAAEPRRMRKGVDADLHVIVSDGSLSSLPDFSLPPPPPMSSSSANA